MKYGLQSMEEQVYGIKNKRVKRVISIVLSVAMVFCGLTLSTSNVSADTSGDFTYTVNGDNTTVTITKYNGAGGAVEIPSTIEDKPVTVIGEEAFVDSALTSVTIPKLVMKIMTYFLNQLLVILKCMDMLNQLLKNMLQK